MEQGYTSIHIKQFNRTGMKKWGAAALTSEHLTQENPRRFRFATSWKSVTSEIRRPEGNALICCIRGSGAPAEQNGAVSLHLEEHLYRCGPVN